MPSGRDRLRRAMLAGAPAPMTTAEMLLAEMERAGSIPPHVLDAAMERALANPPETPAKPGRP